jgi:predicted permease
MRQLDQQPALGYLVTPDFFEMLGARIAIGRPFTPEDAVVPGSGAYVVLSHDTWKSRYGSDPQILGRKVLVRGHPFEVIGVAVPEFMGVGPAPADFWAPLTMYSALHDGADLFSPTIPGSLIAVLRLRPDVSVEVARAALLRWSREQTKDYPEDQRAVGVYMESRASAVPLNRNVLLAFAPIFVAFGLVLLTGSANVSNMMLARAVMRQREIGVRLSLGAGRARLIRQLLTEAMLLAATAGIAGVVISELTMLVLREVFYRTIPAQFGRLLKFPEMHPDYRVFGFVAMAAVLATLAFGLLPALQATRSDLGYAMRGDFGGGFRQSRLRNALVVAQALVCALLLITSLIMLRSETRIAKRDLRVDPRGVLDVRLPSKPAEVVAERFRREPIIESMAAVSRAPLYGGLPALGIAPADGNQRARSYFNLVSPEYFELLRIGLVSGRNFTLAESTAQAAVVIISEATAQRFWPSESPLGKEIRIEADRRNRLFVAPAFARAQVIGVVRDVVNGFPTATVDPACVYFPLSVGNASMSSLLVRVHGDADAARVVIERVLQEVAPSASDLVMPLEKVVATGLYPFRVMSWVASFLAVLAMVLVVSGIYGVLSFVVSQRQKELGIRMALGASRGDVVMMILGQSTGLAMIGMALGVAATLAVARVIAHQFDTIRPFEPLPYVVATALVLIAAAAAGWVPSRRASGVDPASTLRND